MTDNETGSIPDSELPTLNSQHSQLPTPLVSAAPTQTVQLAYRIRDEVIRYCKPGGRIASERLLAEKLDTSRGVVRRALQQLVQEGWLRRKSGSGHFVATPSHRLTHTTALLMPVRAANLLREPFFHDVFIGLSEAAEMAGRHVLTLSGGGSSLRDAKDSAFWSPKMRIVDSLITFEVFSEIAVEQAALLYPVVCMDAFAQTPNVSTVNFDHAASIKMAAKYLMDLGHRRIGFVGRVDPDADPAVGLRYTAYHDALRLMSLPEDSQWSLAVRRNCDPIEMAARWRQLPEQRRPTAMIMVDMFWPLVSAWISSGVRIPDELSLVNIGMVHGWSDYLNYAWHAKNPSPLQAVCTPDVRPPFANHPPELALIQPTTVELPALRMGAWGIEEVVRRLKNSRSAARHELLPPKLVVGGTTRRVTQT